MIRFTLEPFNSQTMLHGKTFNSKWDFLILIGSYFIYIANIILTRVGVENSSSSPRVKLKEYEAKTSIFERTSRCFEIEIAGLIV